MKINKSWIQAGILVLAIMGGITLVNRLRARRLKGVMGESEANILAQRLRTGMLPAEEYTRINQKLAAAGYKAVDGKALKL